MLFCEQKKYAYAQNGQQLETERLHAEYNGGLWTTITKTESKYDDYDHLIQQKDWEDSGTKQGLICRKSKSFVRNSEGDYDPKETVYRDRQGLITKSKVYERRQTDLADTPLLFGKEENFSYPNGEKKVESHRELFYFMRNWLTMDTYQKLVQSAQKLKQDRISQLETELARLKGEQTAGKQQPEPFKYVSGIKRDGR